MECSRLSEKNLMTIPRALKNWYSDYQTDGRTGYVLSGIRQISRGQTLYGGDPSAHLPLPDIEPKFAGIVLGK